MRSTFFRASGAAILVLAMAVPAFAATPTPIAATATTSGATVPTDVRTSGPITHVYGRTVTLDVAGDLIGTLVIDLRQIVAGSANGTFLGSFVLTTGAATYSGTLSGWTDETGNHARLAGTDGGGHVLRIELAETTVFGGEYAVVGSLT